MGFFDTITNIKNLITGGSAEVRLEFEPVKLSDPFNISMRVMVANEKLKIKGAYLIIQSIEDIKMPNKDIPKRDDEGNKIPEKMIRSHTITSEQKIEMSDGLELQENEEYVWESVVKLESDNQPTYEGIYCKHHYRVKGYIDCYGNNPDSSWVKLEVG